MSGIDDIVGSEAVVQPARGFGIGDGFADGNGERDDIVADFGFDFEDVGNVDAGAFAEAGGGFAGNGAGFGEDVSGGELDIEPFLEFVFVAPELAHLGARVARNHEALRLERRKRKALKLKMKFRGEVPKDMITEKVMRPRSKTKTADS